MNDENDDVTITDDDFDIEEDEQDEISTRFQKAADYLPQLLAKVSVSDDDLLYLYSRFKYAIEGRCNTRRPGFLEFQAKKKWDAWNSVTDIDQDEAKLQYIAKIKKLDPGWDVVKAEGMPKAKVQKPKTATSWVSVSSMVANSEVVSEDEKSVFDWCRDGNLDVVKRLLERSHVEVDAPDEIGLTLLHWACDRGHIDIVRYLLVNAKADVNATDSEGQTPLHYACACSHADIVKELLENRADLKIKDKQEDTPMQVAEDEKIKKLVSSWVFWRGSGESVKYD